MVDSGPYVHVPEVVHLGEGAFVHVVVVAADPSGPA